MVQRLDTTLRGFEAALGKQLVALSGELVALQTIAGSMWAALEEEDEIPLATLIPQSMRLLQRSAAIVQLAAIASLLDTVCDDLDDIPAANPMWQQGAAIGQASWSDGQRVPR